MSARYIVLEGSVSRHCCFEATIVDTTKPEIIRGKHYERDGVKQYITVCECFETKDANYIAAALNSQRYIK